MTASSYKTGNGMNGLYCPLNYCYCISLAPTNNKYLIFLFIGNALMFAKPPEMFMTTLKQASFTHINYFH